MKSPLFPGPETAPDIELRDRYLRFIRASGMRDASARRMYFLRRFAAVSLVLAIVSGVGAIRLPGLLLLAAFLLLASARFALEARHSAQIVEEWEQAERLARVGVVVRAYPLEPCRDLFDQAHGGGGGEQTSWCRVLFSFQPEVAGDADYMRWLAGRVHERMDRPPRRRRGTGTGRFQVPLSLTDGSTVYCDRLMLHRDFLSDADLDGAAALVCLATAGEESGVALVPAGLSEAAEVTPPTPPSAEQVG